MTKINNKQLKAQIINDVSKKYKERITTLEEENKKLRLRNYELIDERGKINEECSELYEKVRQYEDWIERLQEFCNMGENERKDVIEKYRTDRIMNETMNKLFSSPIFKMFSELY